MPKKPAAAAQASAASAAPVAAQKDSQQVEEGEDQEAQQKGFKGQATKDMQNVSGYFDERVGDKVDEGKIGKAMTFLTDVSKKQKAQKSARDKELAKVVLTKEDVELIMNEFQIGKGTAERALRESKGDVLETLRRLIAA
ncbi:uncharacterized protein SPPG_03048 [Spizellomyces punctatus DAOM BR117]|uniref:Nascent polypeptide-associated complex subunit alpha-like UBA domain-containing protein n=1 Tax=Spizellomyces punctatus (strain DAOM BR117) TaxID=645134 RepID=A0A0L0HNE4_SPIPD|nr:uncharacterized protein SPPG_03048 [Spizellomyces punctatus DAOM BR117]KND02592.1 hypothetical protein SPPG_03048 [Spizellomyces punctatus DAOM BR117]|eukprot:XP_016610631.1 hypothetical protein SPPG_03048 [Spizellomyces punctatus DAOM BR117]